MSQLSSDLGEAIRAAVIARDGHVSGDEIRFLCPIHEDDGRPHTPSASWNVAKGTWFCHVCKEGFGALDLAKRLGIPTAADDCRSPHSEFVATYSYADEKGDLLFQVCRTADKEFPVRRPDASSPSGWAWSLKGVRRVLYRLPRVKEAIERAETIYIPEGEKDVEAIEATGSFATCNPGGAEKWRQEFSDQLAGAKRVLVIADKDEAGRRHARKVLGALMPVVGLVHVVEAATGKDAADHLAAGHSIEDLVPVDIDALDSAGELDSEPTPDEQPMIARSPGVGVTKSVADEILGSHSYAQDEGGKLYVFRHGVYRPDGEQHVKRAVKRILLARNKDASWNTKRANEVVEFIRVDAQHLWPCPPTDTLNVANGLLDVSTRTLRPHDPNFLSPVQLPAAFDSSATCPAWDAFISSTFPDDAQRLAWEIPACLAVPGLQQKKAILLVGTGDNGKSVFLAAVIAFLGRLNISSVSLHRLEGSRFASARLIGKLANICADLSGEHLKGTSTFKGLTGGDIMEAERKFRDSFDFAPFTRLVFSANTLPRSPDASEAYFRRWLVVPFDRTFDGAERIDRRVLDARLAAPRELSGVLNRALDALPAVTANGYARPKSVQVACDEFRRVADPLSVWIERNVVPDSEAILPKEALVDGYRRHAEQRGFPAATQKAIGTRMRALFPQIRDGQRTVNRRPKVWCWIGIGQGEEG